jgi:cysteinyl-tRNA synthetase
VSEVPDEVLRLAEERAGLRAEKGYDQADRLRDRIRELGFEVVDRPDGFDVLPAARAAERMHEPAQVHGVLDRPPTVDFSVHWLAEKWPEDVLRGVASFRKFEEDRAVQHVVVETEATPPTEWPPDLEVLPLAGDPGFGESRNAQLRRSLGRIVLVTDGSAEAIGDVYAPLKAALSKRGVGIAGPLGIVTDDLREFREDEGPEVDAIESFLMAFRRELLEKGLAFDPRFRFFRNADIDFSFQIKALRLKALRLDLPVRRHRHRMWSTTPEGERERLSKRNFYRFLDRFRGRTDLLESRRI